MLFINFEELIITVGRAIIAGLSASAVIGRVISLQHGRKRKSRNGLRPSIYLSIILGILNLLVMFVIPGAGILYIPLGIVSFGFMLHDI